MRIAVLGVLLCLALRADDLKSGFTGVWTANVRKTPPTAPNYLFVTLDDAHDQLTVCSVTGKAQAQRLEVRQLHVLNTLEVVKLNSSPMGKDVVLVADDSLTFSTHRASDSITDERWRITRTGKLIITSITKANGHTSTRRSVYQRAAFLP